MYIKIIKLRRNKNAEGILEIFRLAKEAHFMGCGD